MGRIVGLDVGSKRIGVAVSDELGLIARPLGVVSRRSYNKDAAAIAEIVAAEMADRLVVGLPLGLAGGSTQQTERTRRFAEVLQARVPVPVDLWDERLTTVIAQRMGPPDRESRRAGRLDTVAAAVMLQSYLDSRRTPSAGPPSSPL